MSEDGLRSLASQLLWGFSRLANDLRDVMKHADRSTWERYLRAVASSVPAILRTRTLVPADQKMADTTCVFHPQDGIRIVLDGRDFSSAREMYCRRVYFWCDGFDIASGDTVVDLGANIGLYTTMAATAGARVVSVEAQSGFLPAIETNLERNGARGRADLVHALIGADTGVLSTNENRRAASEWGKEPQRLRMADLIDRYQISQIDLLKIDIEGSEFDLFREEVFLDIVTRIAMEVHPDHGDIPGLIERLERHGFRVDLLDSEGATTKSLVGSRGGYIFARRAK